MPRACPVEVHVLFLRVMPQNLTIHRASLWDSQICRAERAGDVSPLILDLSEIVRHSGKEIIFGLFDNLRDVGRIGNCKKNQGAYSPRSPKTDAALWR